MATCDYCDSLMEERERENGGIARGLQVCVERNSVLLEMQQSSAFSASSHHPRSVEVFECPWSQRNRE
jgi:hypothetical protein